MVKQKLKVIYQYYGNDCGPTSLMMIFKYFGLDLSLYSIRNLTDTKEDGTSMKSLIFASKHFGFKAEAFKTNSIEHIKDIKSPFIINIIRNGQQHFTVVDKVLDKHIKIADPLDGNYKMTHQEFFDCFTGYLLIVKPTDNLKNNIESQKPRPKMYKSLLKNNIGKIIVVLLGTILMNITSIINIYFFKKLMDDIIPFNDLQSLNFFSIILISLFIVSTFLNYIRTKLIIFFSQSLEKSLVEPFLNHVIHLPLEFFQKINAGEIVSRINDVYKIRDAVATISITFLLDLIMLFVGAIILLYLNFKLFSVILILVPIYIISFLVFNKKYKKYNYKEMEMNAEADSYLVQGINNITDIKANTNENTYYENYKRRFRKLLNMRFHLENTENVEISIRSFIDSMIALIILWYGVSQVITEQISLGDLLIFIALLSYFLNPLNNLIGVHPLINSARVATRRIQDIFMIYEEDKEKNTTEKLKFNQVNFENVGLKYFEKDIFKSVNISIEKGENILISGKSGSGKTSLVKTLLKFTNPTQGKILIDGINLNSINLDYLRKNIAYIGDSPFFFKGTIYENLTFGLEYKPKKNEILKICSTMQINDMIENLPNGLETILQDNATNLSSGQRQRLYIVKSLLKRPSIIILDEATNHLDSETEEKVLRNLNAIKKKEKLIIVTINHNLRTKKHSDKILEI